MNVNFRCGHCGKLLTIDAQPNHQAKCPGCGQLVTVPDALAAMPRPQVSTPLANQQITPNASEGGSPAAAQALASRSAGLPTASMPAAEAPAMSAVVMSQDDVEGQAVLGVMAKVMPWVISVFFHLALALLMAFGTMIVSAKTTTAAPEYIVIPDAEFVEDPGGTVSPSKGGGVADSTKIDNLARTEFQKTDVAIDSGMLKGNISVLGAGGMAAGGGGSGNLGLPSGGGGGAGAPGLLGGGRGGNVHHVVYVIDRSGSMLLAFDNLRSEMLISISKLKPVQDFHVIFFAAGTPIESPPKQLVQANEENKALASQFLSGNEISPDGQTNPLPALRRAFEVLEKAAPDKPGKLIYLLTDGDFTNNDEVMQAIKEWNSKKEVHISTFFYNNEMTGRSKTGNVQTILKRIADENGGRYTDVDQGE